MRDIIIVGIIIFGLWALAFFWERPASGRDCMPDYKQPDSMAVICK